MVECVSGLYASWTLLDHSCQLTSPRYNTDDLLDCTTAYRLHTHARTVEMSPTEADYMAATAEEGAVYQPARLQKSRPDQVFEASFQMRSAWDRLNSYWCFSSFLRRTNNHSVVASRLWKLPTLQWAPGNLRKKKKKKKNGYNSQPCTPSTPPPPLF